MSKTSFAVPGPRGGRERAASALIGAAFLCAFSACGFEPEPAPMHYALAPATMLETNSAPAVRDQIATSLEGLFGTPQDPGYAPSPAWTEAGVDLMHPERAAGAGRGSGELDESALRAIAVANEKAFARALARIDAGDIDDAADSVRRHALDLSRALASAPRATPVDDATKKTARALVADWYPSLRESAELYRVECLQCHGVEGGGDGPTAFGLVPKPRDFRKGIFKYAAVKDQAHPRRADLLRTLDQGVAGTSMGNYQRLSLTERQGLVDYVRFLSIRGEVEAALVATWKEDGALKPESADSELALVWSKWVRAPSKYVAFDGDVPPATKERIARGDALFHDPLKGNCASCHGADGRGDGAAAWKVDANGKRSPAYVDAWGQSIAPRNLRDGVFRGGSRPIDVYRRIYSGIAGGPMPALGESRDAQGELLLSPEDLWCLVHYVRALAGLHEVQ